jgi:hypothetical protein
MNIYAKCLNKMFANGAIFQGLTAAILVILEIENRRILVQGQSGQKLCKTPSQQKKSGSVVCDCHSSDGGKPKTGVSWSRLVWAENKTLSPK